VIYGGRERVLPRFQSLKKRGEGKWRVTARPASCLVRKKFLARGKEERGAARRFIEGELRKANLRSGYPRRGRFDPPCLMNRSKKRGTRRCGARAKGGERGGRKRVVNVAPRISISSSSSAENSKKKNQSTGSAHSAPASGKKKKRKKKKTSRTHVPPRLETEQRRERQRISGGGSGVKQVVGFFKYRRKEKKKKKPSTETCSRGGNRREDPESKANARSSPLKGEKIGIIMLLKRKKRGRKKVPRIHHHKEKGGGGRGVWEKLTRKGGKKKTQTPVASKKKRVVLVFRFLSTEEKWVLIDTWGKKRRGIKARKFSPSFLDGSPRKGGGKKRNGASHNRWESGSPRNCSNPLSFKGGNAPAHRSHRGKGGGKNNDSTHRSRCPGKKRGPKTASRNDAQFCQSSLEEKIKLCRAGEVEKRKAESRSNSTKKKETSAWVPRLSNKKKGGHLSVQRGKKRMGGLDPCGKVFLSL